MARSREGAFESTSLDGVPTAGYFSTSPLGWSFIAAMPRQEFTGRLPQAVQRIAVGALALLALSMAGAVWVSRRIERPIRALKSDEFRADWAEYQESAGDGTATLGDHFRHR